MLSLANFIDSRGELDSQRLAGLRDCLCCSGGGLRFWPYLHRRLATAREGEENPFSASARPTCAAELAAVAVHAAAAA